MSPVTAALAVDGGPPPFPRPAALESQVRFWRAIFTEYSQHQVVLHDALYPDKIYKVLDFRGHARDGLGEERLRRLKRIETDRELERVRATLLRLHGLGPNPQSLTPEEQHVYGLFRDDPDGERFLAAAGEKRLRSQSGLRERFGEGIRVSRRYLPEMERIFRAEGLPIELTRLPLIESCYDLRAYSKAGAAGIWQFMPSTGRLFMRVDDLVDERRDPIASTRAAAGFLRRLHAALDTWPLAITAYNHGPEGIARAVRAVGSSDIETIIRDYRGPAFGFASRNFYTEFLAALDIDRDYRSHFGELPLDTPLAVTEYRLDRPIGIEVAAGLAQVDSDDLAQLNPALSRLVTGGRRMIPAGYRLRLPEASAAGFEERLAGYATKAQVVRVATRSDGRRSRGRATVVSYRVQPGQTLSEIAKEHRVSVSHLRSTNRIGRPERLRAGQVIKIPVSQTAM
jgi:membrane-bound lytic murein transglycosylase D